VDAGLSSVLDAREREAPVRLGASVVAGLLLGHSLGWGFTLAWFGGYVAAQGFEQVCRRLHHRRPGRLTRALALASLSLNLGAYGLIGIRFCLAMSTVGLGCCALMLGALVLTTLRVTRVSKAAFGASMWPLAVYAFAAPLFLPQPLPASSLVNYEALALVLMAYSLITWRQSILALQAEQKVLRELEAARVAAETANAAKGEFLANMSHEIRTPLNGVLAMAQLMAKGELDLPQREKLDVIRASGQDLLHVINDILDVSKIEAGKLELEVISFDTEAMLEATLAGFAAVAERKLIALQLEIAAGARGMRQGDPSRVRQILNNFVSNALKFTPEGGRVLISIEGEGAQGRGGLTLAVRDSGIGIPPEKMPMLFQKFTQVDASTTRQFGGTGLGLAICRELAALMGGEHARPGLDLLRRPAAGLRGRGGRPAGRRFRGLRRPRAAAGRPGARGGGQPDQPHRARHHHGRVRLRAHPDLRRGRGGRGLGAGGVRPHPHGRADARPGRRRRNGGDPRRRSAPGPPAHPHHRALGQRLLPPDPGVQARGHGRPRRQAD
jgi:signal transduction histidine kinase